MPVIPISSARVGAKSNRKPADELADLREQIRILTEREQILRSQMIAGQVSLYGDEHEVHITISKSERINTNKIVKELGREFLRPYLRVREITFVRTKKIGGSCLD